jgi:hypothetical protein
MTRRKIPVSAGREGSPVWVTIDTEARPAYFGSPMPTGTREDPFVLCDTTSAGDWWAAKCPCQKGEVRTKHINAKEPEKCNVCDLWARVVSQF